MQCTLELLCLAQPLRDNRCETIFYTMTATEGAA